MEVRFEFWERNNVYGVTMVIGNDTFKFTEKDSPIAYSRLSNIFKDIPGKMEYPQDDSGIEVHRFVSV